jgi:biopolymer transport protein ExbD
MSMNVSQGSDDDVMVDINTTPLIDVLLVLIVMLIITIPVQTHAVKMDMPVGAPPPKTVEPEKVDIVVDFDGSVLWNGNAVNGGQLTSYLKQAAASNPMPEIHLRPHKLAKYDMVAKILAISQRLGVTTIGIVGNDQFD